MALISITTSLNVAGMLALRWKWVNLGEEPVIVGTEILPPKSLGVRENFYRGKFGSPRAKSRKRNMPLADGVVAGIAEIRSHSTFRAPDHLVFASAVGTPVDECNLMRRVVKPIAQRLGMPWLSWHVVRRTHATLGEQIGMALSDRQTRMGHGDIRMTLHYTHSDLNRRRAGVQAITDKLIGNPRIVTPNDTKNQEP